MEMRGKSANLYSADGSLRQATTPHISRFNLPIWSLLMIGMNREKSFVYDSTIYFVYIKKDDGKEI